MPDPYYCKLYIGTDEAIDDLQAELDEACERIFSNVEVEAPAFRNEDFDPDAGEGRFRRILSSRYYVEIGTIEEIPDQIADFQSGVAELVKSLRAKGRVVTVSGSFEDVIVEKTGSN